MKRLNSRPTDKRSFKCPQCGKQRMIRSPDHVVSMEEREYKSKDGTPVSIFLDTCDFCKTRNFQKYFEPSRADLRRVIKAIQTETQVDEDKSLEDLL